MSYPAGRREGSRPRVTAAIDVSQALSPPPGRTLVIVLVVAAAMRRAASADRSPRPFPDELHVLAASSFTLIWAISRRHS